MTAFATLGSATSTSLMSAAGRWRLICQFRAESTGRLFRWPRLKSPAHAMKPRPQSPERPAPTRQRRGVPRAQRCGSMSWSPCPLHPPIGQRGVVAVLTPNRTTLMLRRVSDSSVFVSSREPSAMLRSASDSVPSCCESASVSAWFEESSRGRSFADNDLLAVLFLDGLIDRQHAHIAKNGFRGAAALFGIAVARSHDHVDPVIRQDEAARAGFWRDLRGNCALALRQDRRHEPRALGVDQFGLTDRFARHEWRAHDHTRKLFDGLWLIVLANEIAARGARGPSLPKYISWRDCLSPGKVGFGDQNVDSVGLRRLDSRGRRFIRSASKQRGNATRCNGDRQHYDSCGFHTLTLTMTMRPARPRKTTWPRMRPLTRDFNS